MTAADEPTVPDEAVEVAVREHMERHGYHPQQAADVRREVRAALAAATPYIVRDVLAAEGDAIMQHDSVTRLVADAVAAERERIEKVAAEELISLTKNRASAAEWAARITRAGGQP